MANEEKKDFYLPLQVFWDYFLFLITQKNVDASFFSLFKKKSRPGF